MGNPSGGFMRREGISYYADFADDIIRFFSDDESGEFSLKPARFGQYFGRLRDHGIRRLVVWLSPFPFIACPNNYKPDDWTRYEKQVAAIQASRQLTSILEEKPLEWNDWRWIRQLIGLRTSEATQVFARNLVSAARAQGIQLTVSFRPFEAAVSRYYEVPCFDETGGPLPSLLPFASPAVNHHADRIGFVHYRTILDAMGHRDYGRIAAVQLNRPGNVERFLDRFRRDRSNLRIVAAMHPPLQTDSLVLHRVGDGYELVAYGAIRESVERNYHVFTRFDIERWGADLRIVGLGDEEIPPSYRYLLLTNPSGEDPIELPSELGDSSLEFSLHAVQLVSTSGNFLGRLNCYWALDENNENDTWRMTRVAGITKREFCYFNAKSELLHQEGGRFHPEFQATESSSALVRLRGPRQSLSKTTLVINFGADWSAEMIDFEHPASRRNVVSDLRHIFSVGFDEVLVNTRSHTHLPGNVDLAYAPRSVVEDPMLMAIVPGEVERVTIPQVDELRGTCQTENEGQTLPWRFARNRAVRRGVEALLTDICAAFPDKKVRVVLPESAAVIGAVESELEAMFSPATGCRYGRDYYYNNIYSSNNYAPRIGEGLAMLNLGNLRIEPVFLGIRELPDRDPLKLFVRYAAQDMQENRGGLSGPHSYFYEAQDTLRDDRDGRKRAEREERICYLLSFNQAIREVILYESADWAKYLIPAIDPHAYLDRCHEILSSKGWLMPEPLYSETVFISQDEAVIPTGARCIRLHGNGQARARCTLGITSDTKRGQELRIIAESWAVELIEGTTAVLQTGRATISDPDGGGDTFSIDLTCIDWQDGLRWVENSRACYQG